MDLIAGNKSLGPCFTNFWDRLCKYNFVICDRLMVLDKRELRKFTLRLFVLIKVATLGARKIARRACVFLKQSD
jgi:hypothetical protein